MKGDFSRKTFNKKKHYSSVRMQQGRVQLDADWNEQMDIWSHRIQTETQDFIGSSGTPYGEGDGGFKIEINRENNELQITAGRYYVDGLLCEKETTELLMDQADLPELKLPSELGYYLIYLDVWQQHITAFDDPDIREPALVDVDTTTRVRNLVQVKYAALNGIQSDSIDKKWETLTEPSDGKLIVNTHEDATLQDQLYRIEIHQAGSLENATFKWSRDNGSVVEKIVSVDGDDITISSSNQVENRKFKMGQWVELSTTQTELHGQPGSLFQIKAVDGSKLSLNGLSNEVNNGQFVNGTVRLWDTNASLLKIENEYINLGPDRTWCKSNSDNEMLLKITLTKEGILGKSVKGQCVELLDENNKKRFAQIEESNPYSMTLSGLSDADKNSFKKFRLLGEGTIPVDKNDFIHLEDGLQIRFSEGSFKTGDYWLIPTRAAVGKVKWLEPQSPHGIKHHYAKLALVKYEKDEETNEKTWTLVEDCRSVFFPIMSFKQMDAITADPSISEPVIHIDNKGDVQLEKDLTVLGNFHVKGETKHKTETTYNGTTTFGGDITTTPERGFIQMIAPLCISTSNASLPNLSLKNSDTHQEWYIYNGKASKGALSIYNVSKEKHCLTIDEDCNLSVAGTVKCHDLTIESGTTLKQISDVLSGISWDYLRTLNQNLGTRAKPKFEEVCSERICIGSDDGRFSDAKLRIVDHGGDSKQQSLVIGNNAYFTGVSQVNTIGIYGADDHCQGAIQLGSLGPKIEGFNNRLKVPILQLGDKWSLTGIGDGVYAPNDQEWLRLLNAEGSKYRGGFAANKLWCDHIRCKTMEGPSDLRKKKNIKPLGPTLDKLLSLRGVYFHWKDDKADSQQKIGLIAQEVEKVFPELVSTISENGEKFLGLQYDKLAPVIIESIKGLYEQIKAIKQALKTKGSIYKIFGLEHKVNSERNPVIYTLSAAKCYIFKSRVLDS